MQLQEVINFIEHKGWTHVESSPKFVHYKPPTELGFKAAYSLPVPAREELEDFDIALNRAANVIAQVYEKPINELFGANGSASSQPTEEFYWNQSEIQTEDGTHVKFVKPILCKVFFNKENGNFKVESKALSIQIETAHFNEIKNDFSKALLKYYQYYIHLKNQERTYTDEEKKVVNFFDENVKK